MKLGWAGDNQPMDAGRQLTELIEEFVSHGPGELTLPIVAIDGVGHGDLLDHATGVLEPKGYDLRSVRISNGIWYATYGLTGPPAR